MDFYNNLSPYYDEMISFEDRLQSEHRVYENILQKFPAKKILDAGCGSGFLSILLSRMGLEITGCDISEEMLASAQKNAERYSVNPIFTFSDFLSLTDVFEDQFDAIFCMGNSFVHLLTPEDQKKALDNFHRLLTPQGYLCLQILNYDKILHEKRGIFSVKKIGDKTITRSYRFNSQTVNFIITIEFPEKEEQFITELYPLQSEELQSILKNTGFKRSAIYSNLNFDRYEQRKSENICLFSYK